MEETTLPCPLRCVSGLCCLLLVAWIKCHDLISTAVNTIILPYAEVDPFGPSERAWTNRARKKKRTYLVMFDPGGCSDLSKGRWEVSMRRPWLFFEDPSELFH